MATVHTDETRTTLDNLFKYDYAQAIQEATPANVVLLNILETKTAMVDFGGKSFIIPVELNNFGSFNSISEGGYYPDAMPGQWLNAVVPIDWHAFSVSVTEEAMETSDQNKFAFDEAWHRSVLVGMKSFRQNINRQLNGDGNGILCQVDGSTSTVYVTVDNAYGISGLNSSAVNGHRFISANMKVDFYSGSTRRNSTITGHRITAFSRGSFPSTSAILTMHASDTITEVADGDYVYCYGSYGNEAPGMRALIDDGTVNATFQSISTSTYPEWKSWVGYGSTAGTAEALTASRLQNAINDVEDYGGGKVDWMLTSPGVYLTLGEISRQENVLMNMKTLDIGWKVLEFNGIPIFKDRFSVDDIYLVDNSAIKLHQSSPAHWASYGGSAIRPSPNRTTAYEAYWRWGMTPAIHNRTKVGKITDITVTVNKW